MVDGAGRDRVVARVGRTGAPARAEGRAPGRLPWRQRTAWQIPTGVGVVASLMAPAGTPHPVWALAGLVAGVLWQLAYRRDLVARLTLPVAVLTVSAVLATLPGTSAELSIGGAVFWVGVLVGLVWTEQYLRWREP